MISRDKLIKRSIEFVHRKERGEGGEGEEASRCLIEKYNRSIKKDETKCNSSSVDLITSETFYPHHTSEGRKGEA